MTPAKASVSEVLDINMPIRERSNGAALGPSASIFLQKFRDFLASQLKSSFEELQLDSKWAVNSAELDISYTCAPTSILEGLVTDRVPIQLSKTKQARGKAEPGGEVGPATEYVHCRREGLDRHARDPTPGIVRRRRVVPRHFASCAAPWRVLPFRRRHGPKNE